MINLLGLAGVGAVTWQARRAYDEYYLKPQAELNNYKSKFNLDQEFLANKLGIENVPDLISSQAEYTKLKEKNIETIKWTEKHENGKAIKPIKPWAKALLVTNALYMAYSEPWTALTCFATIVAAAVIFGEPLLDKFAEDKIKYFRTTEQFELKRKIENAEKKVKASDSDLTGIRQQITLKMDEYLNDSSEESTLLLKEAQIQLAKINLILSNHLLAQKEGQAPA